jgi:hypothetical protein
VAFAAGMSFHTWLKGHFRLDAQDLAEISSTIVVPGLQDLDDFDVLSLLRDEEMPNAVDVQPTASAAGSPPFDELSALFDQPSELAFNNNTGPSHSNLAAGFDAGPFNVVPSMGATTDAGETSPRVPYTADPLQGVSSAAAASAIKTEVQQSAVEQLQPLAQQVLTQQQHQQPQQPQQQQQQHFLLQQQPLLVTQERPQQLQQLSSQFGYPILQWQAASQEPPPGALQGAVSVDIQPTVVLIGDGGSHQQQQQWHVPPDFSEQQQQQQQQGVGAWSMLLQDPLPARSSQQHPTRMTAQQQQDPGAAAALPRAPHPSTAPLSPFPLSGSVPLGPPVPDVAVPFTSTGLAAAAAADQDLEAAQAEAAGTDEEGAAADAGKDKKAAGGPKRYRKPSDAQRAAHRRFRQCRKEQVGSFGSSRCCSHPSQAAAVVSFTAVGHRHLHHACCSVLQATAMLALSASVGASGFKVARHAWSWVLPAGGAPPKC